MGVYFPGRGVIAMRVLLLTLRLAVAGVLLAGCVFAGSISVGPGATPGGYLPLSLFGVSPIAGVGNDTAHGFGFGSHPFVFGGEVFTSLQVSSNGYVTVGGSGAASSVNQSLPDSAAPNGVLAPFWTDLDPSAGGTMRIALLSDGTSRWIVVDWESVPNSSDHAVLNSFQAWIGTNGVEDISFTYGAVGSGDNGLLTVGAENVFGSVGNNYYFNGAGTLPVNGTELRVSSLGSPNTVPEPATAISLLAGLCGVGFLRLRKRRRSRVPSPALGR